MKVEILDNTKKKKILSILDQDYGIENIPMLLIKTSKDKIRAYSGDLSREELNDIAKNMHIELIGTQLCTLVDNDQHVRLNFDVMNLPVLKAQISKNILEINEKQKIDLLNGKNLEMPSPFKSPFLVLKLENDFFGIAKNRDSFLQNYLPKEKRMKVN